MESYFDKKRDFEAVIFDLDGVIFDSESKVVECWKVIAAKYGIEGIEDACRQCLGLNKDATRQRMKQIFGEDFPYDERKAESSALFHSRYSGGRLPLKPGIEHLLIRLKENGKKIAVASSSRKEYVVGNLTEVGLSGYFDRIICGDMVKNSKPHPEIYLTACDAINVLPEKAYAIEDSFNGIRSAVGAGIKTIMVPDRVQPDREIESLTEVVLDSLENVEKYLSLG